MNELLVNFIEKALKNGETSAQIKKTLILRGTSVEEVDEVFEVINKRKREEETPEPQDATLPQEVTPQTDLEPASSQPAPISGTTPQSISTPSVPEGNITKEEPAVEPPSFPLSIPTAPETNIGVEVPVGSGIKEDWGSEGVQKPKVETSIIKTSRMGVKSSQAQAQISPKITPQTIQEGGPSGRLKYMEPKKSKKGLLLLFLVIFVPLLVASAGGYYYYFHILQNPDKIINRMIQEMQNVNTYHQKMDMSVSFDMDVGMTEENVSKLKSKSSGLVSSVILSQLDFGENEVDVDMEKCVAEDGTKIDCGTPEPLVEAFTAPALNGEKVSLSLSLEGDSDVTNKNNPKSLYTIAVSGPFFEDQLNLEAITVGSVQYYRIKHIPTDVSLILSSFVDLSAIENKWIKLDIKSLLEQEKLFGVGADLGLSDEIEKMKEEFSPEKMVDKMAELQVLLANSEIIEVTEDFGVEKIEGGVSAYHYGFKVSEENIKQFIKSAFAIIYGGIVEDVMTVEEITESLGEIKLEGELWIGKKDYLLYKADVKMSTTIRDEMFSATTNYDMALSMSDFNMPVNIQGPTDYVDVVELITEMFSDAGAGSLSGDAFNVSSLGTLKGYLDIYYVENKSYPDVKNVTNLINKLVDSGIILSNDMLVTTEYDKKDTNSFYCYRKAGQHYILGTVMEDAESLYLSEEMYDLDGVYLCGATTKDCADPVFCIGPE